MADRSKVVIAARATARSGAEPAMAAEGGVASGVRMRLADGSFAALNTARLAAVVAEACGGLESISADELALAPILAARTLIETEPDYAKVSARLLLDKLRREALTFIAGRPERATQAEMAASAASDSASPDFDASLRGRRSV